MSTEFQSKADQAVADFGAQLFTYVQGHEGFDSLAKASDPSLADRRELQLGNLTDQELAHELNTLNGYLREEREFYQRGMYFYRLLDAAEQRIKHLSGRLARMGKDVVGDMDGDMLTRESFAACEQLIPMAGKFDTVVRGRIPDARDWVAQVCDKGQVLSDDPQVAALMCEESTQTLAGPPGGMEFIPADGAPIEVAAAVEAKEFIDKYPRMIEFRGRRGLAIGNNRSIMMSASFDRSYGEVRRATMRKSELMGRILTQFTRVAFAVGIHDNDLMEDMAVSIFRKHPNVSHKLVEACLEVGNPFWHTVKQSELEELLGNLQDLVTVVDPRPVQDNG